MVTYPMPRSLRIGGSSGCQFFYTAVLMLGQLPPDILSSVEIGVGMSDIILMAGMTASIQ